MSRVLITGITGLVGKHLMYRLISDGRFQITGQYLTPRSLNEFTAMGVRMRQVDICEQLRVKDLCINTDVVVHCAARVIDYGSRNDFYRCHYDATRWLLEDALKHGVRHFIYISCLDVTSQLDRSFKIPDERDPIMKSGIPYNDAKIDTESFVKSFCTLNGIFYTIIRPGTIIGANSVWVREPLRRAKSRLGLRLINGGQEDACLIGVDNLVEGIFLCLILPEARNRIYFLVDNYGITWEQYFTDLLAIKGLKPKGNISKSMALSIARTQELLQPLFHFKSALTLKSVITTSSDRRVSINRAYIELGWDTRISYADVMKSIADSLNY